MDRMESLGGMPLMVRTRQLGPNSWCCDVFEVTGQSHDELFLLEQFGESEMEAVAMALTEVVH